MITLSAIMSKPIPIIYRSVSAIRWWRLHHVGLLWATSDCVRLPAWLACMRYSLITAARETCAIHPIRPKYCISSVTYRGKWYFLVQNVIVRTCLFWGWGAGRLAFEELWNYSYRVFQHLTAELWNINLLFLYEHLPNTLIQAFIEDLRWPFSR